MNRIHNLDYLRGLSAFGIMFYHFMSWTFGKFNSSHFLGKFGLYGVAIFYVLSGLTLYHVYNNRLRFNVESISDFFKKRFFRIIPLLFLATILGLAITLKAPDYPKLILNITGLSGLFDWSNYYATGAWSIGNELVFYLFIPVFVFLNLKSKISLCIFSLFVFSIFIHFAFYGYTEGKDLLDKSQWHIYVNPLNQLFLFLSGFLIGVFFSEMKINNWILVAILISSFCIFTFYPASGPTINLVKDYNRILYSFLCILICFSFYKIIFEIPKNFHKIFCFLGEVSFSVYLLHPIIYTVSNQLIKIFEKKFFSLNIYIKIPLLITETLIFSYLVYTFYEKAFMKLAKSSKKKF